MKKIVFLFVCLLAVSLNVSAGNDKPIQVSEMPKSAQQFIKNHFADQSVAVAKVETEFMDKSYDVIFTNGDKVEFDKKGKWTKVDCEHTAKCRRPSSRWLSSNTSPRIIPMSRC